jgi:beta-lactamase regulating signal transducer with metallopeptidase domain
MKLIKNTVSTLKRNPDLMGRLLMMVVVIAVLALAIFLSSNKRAVEEMSLPTPTAENAPNNVETPESTLPAYDVFSDFASTTGVVVAAGSVVFILMVGIFIELLRGKKE